MWPPWEKERGGGNVAPSWNKESGEELQMYTEDTFGESAQEEIWVS